MRKPYTITKQREKWTEEEHRKFLEALKLHQRAWPRIQEHIGTKSAVQIRSHAQKFFAKMEKAHNEGIPLDQTLDIEIPPPRPKRKPCSPYPQKTCLGALSSYEQPGVTKMQQKKKQTSVDGSCLEVHSHFQGATSASISFGNKSSSNPCQDVAQLMQAAKNKTTLEEACGSSIFNGNTEVEKSSADFSARKGNFITPPTKRAQETIALEIRQSDKQVSSFAEHSSSSMSSYIHQLLPSVPPSTQFCSDQDAYKSFLNISSSVSGLILSTLLQNPTAHAAASIAASFWPSSPTASIPMELHSEIHKEISERVSTSYLSSNTAAIVAATVAAASAWWETHGILPMVPSTHPQSFSPAPPAPSPSPSVPAPTMGKDKILQNQVANTSELPLPQSSDLDASGTHERSHCHEPKSSTAMTLRLVSVTGLPDSDEARDTKQPDASSSGSNTPSSNEAEKTTMLDKNEETNDEAKQVYYGNHFTSEADVHRHRSGGSIYELGKISKQGQLASGILFTGEVVHPADTDTEAITLQLDLNRNTTLVSGHNFAQEKICENNDNSKEGRNVKLKSEWRGFKPYKRCSMDGKEVKATK